MSLNQYVCEVMVAGPSLVIATGRFRIDGTSNPDLVVDGAPSAVKTGVVRNGEGDFTVTLPKVGGGYPQELISCDVSVAYIDATDAGVDEINKPGYVVGSYDPATGAFGILNVIVTGSTSTAVGDPNDNSEIHFLAVLRNEKLLGQTV